MKKKKKWIIAMFLILFLFSASVLLLKHGNHQWCRWIYIYQARVNNYEPTLPRSFTGTWRRWHPSGHLSFKANFINGKPHGKMQMWYPSGAIWRDCNYTNGTPSGLFLTYYDPKTTSSTGIADHLNYMTTGREYSGFSETGQKIFGWTEDYETNTKIRWRWDTNGVLISCSTNKMD